MTSQTTNQGNSQEKAPWILLHQNLATLLFSLLGLIISTYLTEIFKPQPPYYEFNIPKVIFALAITGFLGLASKLALAYVDGVIRGIYYLRTNLISEVKTEVKTGTQAIEGSLNRHGNTIAETSFRGLYRLLSDKDARANLEGLENQIFGATGADSPLRGVILDFVVRSLASIGRNGFAMVDAEVDTYVKFIAETAQKAKKVIMTCLVRPYWFVVDEIQGATLPPYEPIAAKYGKGEHLRFFGTVSPQSQRWLVLNEHTLAEMLLTAYLDKYFVENVAQDVCPICQCVTSPIACPFHQDRIFDDSIDDIPEIWWFKKDVNQLRGVTLLYTRISADLHYKELEDRVFIHDPHSLLDIRFNFTNLEKGILRIRWGNQAQPLAWITRFQTRINAETGSPDADKGHKFYKSFGSGDILKDGLRRTIIAHLDLLVAQINKYFNSDNVASIGGRFATEIKALLANGNNDFMSNISEATTQLRDSIDPAKNNQTLLQTYSSLVTFYKRGGIPKVSYIVTHDPYHPRYPVRVARWKFNWDGDGLAGEGIKNVPD